jgi:hypothetical protein
LVFGLVAELVERMETKSSTSSTVPGDRREVTSLSGPPHGFRGYKWGAPPGSDLRRRGDPTADGISIYALSSSKPAPLLGVSVAEEGYFFSNGKFYSGSAWLDGEDNFTRIRAALIEAYGQPAFSNEQLRLWKWKWPGSPIEVHLYFHGRSEVTFVNNGI